jgi:nucleoside 2-deoxyribosyltransferase
MRPLVYTAGPITDCDHSEANDWREKVRKEFKKSNIHTISPMRGKPALEKGQKYTAAVTRGFTDPLRTSDGINTRDYNDVRRADLIFVNMLGAKKVSIGTVMEVAWARAFNKPVVLVMEESGNPHDHWMFKFPCGFIVPTIEEGIRVAEYVLLTDNEMIENAEISAQIGCGNGKCGNH